MSTYRYFQVLLEVQLPTAGVVGLPTSLPGCLVPRAVLLAPFITLGRQSSKLSQHRLVSNHKIIEAFKTAKKNTTLHHLHPACLQIVRNWLRNLLTASQYGRVPNHLYEPVLFPPFLIFANNKVSQSTTKCRN